ncbi:hypothetical protein EXIGLDRAFT_762329 [Exidia glandulosa HHB12029]|uniref:Uncharacterized protein n=1 Tax=Exidia glandulosa HHB12029 TaxID=1314781 RepID=A0A165MWL3_EXIGL|nr:hypothetical protein EXIGLDRAFT_762329 [Exidia glandulosa HHB12029]
MRKAWLVALLVPGVLAQATQDSSTTDNDAPDKAANTYDRAAEASQAYDKALKTLSTIGSVQAPHEDGQAALFSNYQGPIASALRIALRLVYQPWLSRSVAYITGKEATLTRRYEDARSKAVKVVDLLTYAAELGNQEALYKLAHISMVRPAYLFHTFAFDPYPCLVLDDAVQRAASPPLHPPPRLLHTHILLLIVATTAETIFCGYLRVCLSGKVDVCLPLQSPARRFGLPVGLTLAHANVWLT